MIRLPHIIVFVNELYLMECLQDERYNGLHRVFSESFSNTDSLSRKEWHVTHRVVFSTTLEPLGFELVMVATPLILKMVELNDVCKEHILSENSNSANINSLSHAEASAEGDYRLHPQSLINNKIQVVVLRKVQSFN